MKTFVQIENLTTGFRLARGKTKILHTDITVSVPENSLVAVLGPNGAGKSTLLRTMAGLQKMLSGDIKYQNTGIKQLTVKELAQKVAVVLTEKPDDLYLSAFDIIAMGRYPYGHWLGNLSENDHRIIRRAAKLTQAIGLMDRKFHTLSDGEKQRVMIARALAQDTPIILLDEPTAFIDSPGKVELLGLLKNIAGQGKAVITTLHDVELALTFADTLWLMGKNNFFESGTASGLVEQGKINDIFDNEQVVFDKKSMKFVPRN